jgi:hypothetical protein
MTKYEIMPGVVVTCKDAIEYMDHALFGWPQAIGLCTGKGHPDPLLKDSSLPKSQEVKA